MFTGVVAVAVTSNYTYRFRARDHSTKVKANYHKQIGVKKEENDALIVTIMCSVISHYRA